MGILCLPDDYQQCKVQITVILDIRDQCHRRLGNNSHGGPVSPCHVADPVIKTRDAWHCDTSGVRSRCWNIWDNNCRFPANFSQLLLWREMSPDLCAPVGVIPVSQGDTCTAPGPSGRKLGLTPCTPGCFTCTARTRHLNRGKNKQLSD